jgi:cytidine deaminase
MDGKALVAVARKSMASARAPYSGFKVGAAVLSKDGRVFAGCNIENVSLSLTVCAERVALFKAVSEGAVVEAIAVASSSGDAAPCGACRQVIAELCPEARIFFEKGGKVVERSVEQLLPERFEPEPLKKRRVR